MVRVHFWLKTSLMPSCVFLRNQLKHVWERCVMPPKNDQVPQADGWKSPRHFSVCLPSILWAKVMFSTRVYLQFISHVMSTEFSGTDSSRGSGESSRVKRQKKIKVIKKNQMKKRKFNGDKWLAFSYFYSKKCFSTLKHNSKNFFFRFFNERCFSVKFIFDDFFKFPWPK